MADEILVTCSSPAQALERDDDGEGDMVIGVSNGETPEVVNTDDGEKDNTKEQDSDVQKKKFEATMMIQAFVGDKPVVFNTGDGEEDKTNNKDSDSEQKKLEPNMTSQALIGDNPDVFNTEGGEEEKTEENPDDSDAESLKKKFVANAPEVFNSDDGKKRDLAGGERLKKLASEILMQPGFVKIMDDLVRIYLSNSAADGSVKGCYMMSVPELTCVSTEEETKKQHFDADDRIDNLLKAYEEEENNEEIPTPTPTLAPLLPDSEILSAVLKDEKFMEFTFWLEDLVEGLLRGSPNAMIAYTTVDRHGRHGTSASSRLEEALFALHGVFVGRYTLFQKVVTDAKRELCIPSALGEQFSGHFDENLDTAKLAMYDQKLRCREFSLRKDAQKKLLVCGEGWKTYKRDFKVGKDYVVTVAKDATGLLYISSFPPATGYKARLKRKRRGGRKPKKDDIAASTEPTVAREELADEAPSTEPTLARVELADEAPAT